jgi:hypothetical protein
MNAHLKLAAPFVAALALAACNAGGTSSLPGSPGQATSMTQGHHVPEWQAKGLARHVCGDVGPGEARCDALLINNGKVQPDEPGWQPLDFQTRYKLPITKGAGQIVAIVDGYDNPNAATDIATYRTEYNLGTADFTKYNQKGQTSNYPAGNANWGLEEDLDIEMVSASCPLCKIYLVEANSNNTKDLEAAEDEAVKLGAHIISNSWGCPGSNACVNKKFFDKKGVLYLSSAGDDGYGTQAPAALASVVAVGGTVFSKNGSGVYNETVWDGTGSGCATGVAKPAWQHDSGCTSRTMNDVSAIAFQVSEYDSYGYNGWFTVGGTSVASPLVGGVFGLAANASKQDAGKEFWSLKKKALKKDLNDITSGTNGSCGGSYLCTGGVGYDGPTGWGTPKGIGAF